MFNDIKQISFEKATEAMGGNFEVQDADPTVSLRLPVKTDFYTQFFNVVPFASAEKDFTHTIVTTAGMQLPSAKRYNEIVGKLDTEQAVKKLFSIGSWGLAWHVMATDLKKINPNTGLRYTKEEKMAEMALNAQMAWDALESRQIFNLLTTDQNFTGLTAEENSKHTSYNFFSEFYDGATRPAAVSMNLSGAVDHAALFEAQEDLLKEDAAKEGVTYTNVYVLCGTNFFNQIREIEQQAGNPREIQSGLDLLSNPTPNMTVGTFKYKWLESSTTAITFIKVNDSVASGVKLGANDAYMLLGGVDYFKRAYTTADRFSAIDSPVQVLYSWSKDKDTGLYRVEESNQLMMSLHPRLIRKLTV